MRCVESNFAAAATSAVGSMQMMLPLLVPRMLFKLTPSSVKNNFVPILWSGARCVYRDNPSQTARSGHFWSGLA